MASVPPPLPVAATRGTRIVLADGRELIDGIASWWTACHGYNHPHIRAAVAAQLERMPHVMFGGLANEPALRLARRLAGMLPDPLSRVFFSESGSVAVEIALKMALQYWLNQGVRGRHRFVSFQGAYHGDTFAAMSVCDPEEGMHSLFAGALPEQHVVPLPEDEAGASPPSMPTSPVTARTWRRSSSSRWSRARAACASTGRRCCARCAHACDRTRPAADRRRDHDRVRPHRHHVRLRAGGRGARHRHAFQGAHRRHHGAGRDCRERAGVRGLPVGRRRRGAHARADLHGQSSGLRRRQCLSRSVRERAPPRPGACDREPILRPPSKPARGLPGVVDVRVREAPSASSSSTT